MADLTIKRGDTYPPLRGAASDADGLLPLADADSVIVVLKQGPAITRGTATVLDPPVDGFNWKYDWQTADTSSPGTYQCELEITWDTTATPDAVETVPNTGIKTIVVEGDLG